MFERGVSHITLTTCFAMRDGLALKTKSSVFNGSDRIISMIAVRRSATSRDMVSREADLDTDCGVVGCDI